MSLATPALQRKSKRHRLLAIFGLLALLFLTACGAKVDSIFTIAADGSGTREFTLTFTQDESTAEYFTGGSDSIEASINKHKPAEIEFLGMTEDGDTLTAEFVINFDSMPEYVIKAKALMAAGNHTWSDSNSHISEQGTLLNGVAIDENFSSTDLMDWLFNGLLADKVVDQEATNSMYEQGSNTVVFGEQKESSDAYTRFDALADLGFDRVALETDISVSPITRTVSFWVEDRSKVIANQDAYDTYFESIKTDQIVVESSTENVGQTWTANFSGDPAEILTYTGTALNSENSVFTLTTEPSAENPAILVTTFNNFADCNSICSQNRDYGNEYLVDTITTPDSNNDPTDSAPEAQDYDLTGTDSPLVFEEYVKFHTATFTMDISPTGQVVLEGNFAIDKDQADKAGEGLVNLIAGPANLEVDSKEDKDQLLYTMEISADNTADFSKAFSKWADTESAIEVVELPDNSFFQTSVSYSAYLNFPSRFGEHLPQDYQFDLTVNSDGGAAFDKELSNGDSLEKIEDSAAHFSTTGSIGFDLVATGKTTKGLITGTVIAVIVIAAIVLVVLYVRKNKAQLFSEPSYDQSAPPAPQNDVAPVPPAPLVDPQQPPAPPAPPQN